MSRDGERVRAKKNMADAYQYQERDSEEDGKIGGKTLLKGNRTKWKRKKFKTISATSDDGKSLRSKRGSDRTDSYLLSS